MYRTEYVQAGVSTGRSICKLLYRTVYVQAGVCTGWCMYKTVYVQDCVFTRRYMYKLEYVYSGCIYNILCTAADKKLLAIHCDKTENKNQT